MSHQIRMLLTRAELLSSFVIEFSACVVCWVGSELLCCSDLSVLISCSMDPWRRVLFVMPGLCSRVTTLSALGSYPSGQSATTQPMKRSA